MPFRAAIEAGVATIMTAHVLVPALDEQRPATLSRRIVTGLLREELGFDGVILSDDLEMKAIADEYAVPAAAVLAIEAGCDGVLICSGDHDTQAAALEALIHAVEEERLPLGAGRGRAAGGSSARRSGSSRRAVAGAAAQRHARCAQALGRDEHRAIADEMARFAVMLKPRALAPGDRLAVVAPASPFDREEFDAASRRSAGSGSSRSTTTRSSRGSAYVAGPPEVRAAAIRAAWRDPSIAGVIAVRGGYGSAQVLPLLDPAEARARAQAVHRLQRPHGDAHVPDDRRAAWSRFTVRCWPDGSAAATAGYDRDSFLTRALPARADGRAGAGRRSRRSERARRPARCSAGR